MTPVDITKLRLPEGWLDNARSLTDQLISAASLDRKKEIIDANRVRTWGNPELVAALRSDEILGNKCWYSELPLEGYDANVDHFRPKGRVSDIEEVGKSKTGEWDGGYWWLAFDYRNYRLSSQHANQRRIDEIGGTDGGKSDFFPVDGERCKTAKPWDQIHERMLPLDPCSPSDVILLRFNTEGLATVRKKAGVTDSWEDRRVRMSIWLFHLNKSDIVSRRQKHMDGVKREFEEADCDYRNWQAGAPVSKSSFDKRLAIIKGHLEKTAPLAGAARSVKIIKSSEYEWVDEYL